MKQPHKKLFPAIFLLFLVILGGCQKEENTNDKQVSALTLHSNVPKSQPPATSGIEPVEHGLSGTFTVLSKSGITNVYPSNITGDVGSCPISGTATLLTCPEVNGSVYSVDPAGPAPCVVTAPHRLTLAVNHMEAAYTDAAGRINPDFVDLGAGIIGGQTFSPGLYKWNSSITIPTDITLDGGTDEVWIFQIEGTITMASAVSVHLTGGAQAKNIFWQASGAVTLGTYSHFEGIILGFTGINMRTGSTLNGRALAQTAVTLQMNTITDPN